MNNLANRAKLFPDRIVPHFLKANFFTFLAVLTNIFRNLTLL